MLLRAEQYLVAWAQLGAAAVSAHMQYSRAKGQMPTLAGPFSMPDALGSFPGVTASAQLEIQPLFELVQACWAPSGLVALRRASLLPVLL